MTIATVRTLGEMLEDNGIACVVFFMYENFDNFVCFLKADGKPSKLDDFSYIDHFEKVIKAVHLPLHPNRCRTVVLKFVRSGDAWRIGETKTVTLARREYETDEGVEEEWVHTNDSAPVIDFDAALKAFHEALRLPAE